MRQRVWAHVSSRPPHAPQSPKPCFLTVCLQNYYDKIWQHNWWCLLHSNTWLWSIFSLVRWCAGKKKKKKHMEQEVSLKVGQHRCLWLATKPGFYLSFLGQFMWRGVHCLPHWPHSQFCSDGTESTVCVERMKNRDRQGGWTVCVQAVVPALQCACKPSSPLFVGTRFALSSSPGKAKGLPSVERLLSLPIKDILW